MMLCRVSYGSEVRINVVPSNATEGSCFLRSFRKQLGRAFGAF